MKNAKQQAMKRFRALKKSAVGKAFRPTDPNIREHRKNGPERAVARKFSVKRTVLWMSPSRIGLATLTGYEEMNTRKFFNTHTKA